MSDKVRVRFAPSPTGYLHVGGARTALFNWLYARHTGGVFILRIEDTDAARNTQEAVDVILNGMRWLGMNWDEGPLTGDATGPCKGDQGPYFQSQRRAIYQRHAGALLSKGHAYEHDGAVRFKMPRDPVLIPDLVVGDVTRELTGTELEEPDFVLIRSDGQPVFHLTNVVDDLEMGITHVIRGEDHLSNTAKHIPLFRALGAEPPRYAHIPLILNADGSKMSKRDTGASMTGYMDEGYVPEAVVNYLCLLGWSPKDNSEKMPLKEIIERFDLPQILRHNARFDAGKLLWLQGEYARELTDDRFYELCVHTLARAGVDTNQFPLAYVKAALDTCKGKLKLFSELPGYGGFYFTDEFQCNPDGGAKHFTPENKPRLAAVRAAFAAIGNPDSSARNAIQMSVEAACREVSSEGIFLIGELSFPRTSDLPWIVATSMKQFDAAALELTLKATAFALGVKVGVLVHPTRLACTGSNAGPSLYHLLEVLGKERVLARIDRALARPEFGG
jgi:glutamyl-tRNA synthetase